MLIRVSCLGNSSVSTESRRRGFAMFQPVYYWSSSGHSVDCLCIIHDSSTLFVHLVIGAF